VKRLILLVVAVMLSGCAPAQFNINEAGPYPDNYKEIVRGYIEHTFFDPYSLRSVIISTPHSGSMAWRSGWWVCFECNAKNRMGGYTGLKRKALLLAQGNVVMNFEDMQLCTIPPYNDLSPWPEMEGK